MTLEQQTIEARKNFHLSKNILKKMVIAVEATNANSDSWTIYSEKIARKYVRQADTLEILLNSLNIEGDNSNFDLSSVFTILRLQLETYATYCHFYQENAQLGERLLRFRLWQLDGLRTRQSYSPPEDLGLIEKVGLEQEMIVEVIDWINDIDYYHGLSDKTKNFMLDKSLWRFSDYSLRFKSNHQKRLTVNQMISNTGLKNSLVEDWYKHTTGHVHSTYSSLMQNDEPSLSDLHEIIFIGLMQGAIINSCFVWEFRKIYTESNNAFNTCSRDEIETIELYFRKSKY